MNRQLNEFFHCGLNSGRSCAMEWGALFRNLPEAMQLAGMKAGFFGSIEHFGESWALETRFSPTVAEGERGIKVRGLARRGVQNAVRCAGGSGVVSRRRVSSSASEAGRASHFAADWGGGAEA